MGKRAFDLCKVFPVDYDAFVSWPKKQVSQCLEIRQQPS